MKHVPLTISITLLLCFYASAQTVANRGAIHEGMYINPDLGFSFKYPKDWVVHGEATNERITEIGKEQIIESGASSKSSAEVTLRNTYYLLTVFRHPVGTPGIAFNPAILVIAEKVAYAPGITNGKDYLLNLRAMMLKIRSHQVLLKEPMEYRFGGSQFFRDNYAVEVNGRHVAQAYFATIANGYALAFIFIAEDEKNLDEMAKSMETFGVTPMVRRGVTTIIGTAP